MKVPRSTTRSRSTLRRRPCTERAASRVWCTERHPHGSVRLWPRECRTASSQPRTSSSSTSCWHACRCRTSHVPSLLPLDPLVFGHARAAPQKREVTSCKRGWGVLASGIHTRAVWTSLPTAHTSAHKNNLRSCSHLLTLSLRVACSFRLIALKPASQYHTRPSAPCAAQCVGCGTLHGAWADAVAHDRTRHGVGRHLSLLRHGCARARHRVSHVRPMPRCARSSASSACSGLTVAFCGARARIGMTCTTNEARRSACTCATVGHLCCMLPHWGAVGRDQRSPLTPSIATARLRVNAPREGGDSPLWRAEVQFSLRAEITHFAA